MTGIWWVLLFWGAVTNPPPGYINGGGGAIFWGTQDASIVTSWPVSWHTAPTHVCGDTTWYPVADLNWFNSPHEVTGANWQQVVHLDIDSSFGVGYAGSGSLALNIHDRPGGDDVSVMAAPIATITHRDGRECRASDFRLTNCAGTPHGAMVTMPDYNSRLCVDLRFTPSQPSAVSMATAQVTGGVMIYFVLFGVMVLIGMTAAALVYLARLWDATAEELSRRGRPGRGQ